MTVRIKHHRLLRVILAVNLKIVYEAPINACSDDLALLFKEAGKLDETVLQRKLSYKPKVLIIY